jgi:hypothetical protein
MIVIGLTLDLELSTGFTGTGSFYVVGVVWVRRRASILGTFFLGVRGARVIVRSLDGLVGVVGRGLDGGLKRGIGTRWAILVLRRSIARFWRAAEGGGSQLRIDQGRHCSVVGCG